MSIEVKTILDSFDGLDNTSDWWQSTELVMGRGKNQQGEKVEGVKGDVWPEKILSGCCTCLNDWEDNNLFEKLDKGQKVCKNAEVVKAGIQISKSLFFEMPLSGLLALPVRTLDNAGVVFLDHARGNNVPL